MRDPWAILLVLASPGDAVWGEHLGGRPPLLHRVLVSEGPGPQVFSDQWSPVPLDESGEDERALPLRWDGALVPSGWDAARRVWLPLPLEQRQLLVRRVFPPALRTERFARAMELAGIGRVVLLDLVDGRQVTRA